MKTVCTLALSFGTRQVSEFFVFQLFIRAEGQKFLENAKKHLKMKTVCTLTLSFGTRQVSKLSVFFSGKGRKFEKEAKTPLMVKRAYTLTRSTGIRQYSNFFCCQFFSSPRRNFC